MNSYKIALLKGDGIGPEIVEQAVKVLDKTAEKFGFEVVDRSIAPRISNCQACPQFHNGCESEIMRIQF